MEEKNTVPEEMKKATSSKLSWREVMMHLRIPAFLLFAYLLPTVFSLSLEDQETEQKNIRTVVIVPKESAEKKLSRVEGKLALRKKQDLKKIVDKSELETLWGYAEERELAELEEQTRDSGWLAKVGGFFQNQYENSGVEESVMQPAKEGIEETAREIEEGTHDLVDGAKDALGIKPWYAPQPRRYRKPSNPVASSPSSSEFTTDDLMKAALIGLRLFF